MLDTIVRGANLQDGRTGIDIGCKDGRIVEVAPRIAAEAADEIDAAGRLVVPPFVDCHLHLDAVLTHGNPRINESGELYEGIDLWADLKATLTPDDYKRRAIDYCHWAIAQGTLAIRAHVDTCDPRLAQVEALIEVRDAMRPYIDLQLVAFPQDGYYRYDGGVDLLRRAVDMGMDAVGGIPDFELTAGLGNESVRELAELAVDRGLLVDMHTDQTLDPQSRQIEALTWQTRRLKLGSRASASHCTSLTMFHDNYAAKLIAQIADAGLNVIVSPMTSATCLKTMTRVAELWDAGVNIGFGQDCVMDPWYAFGKEDMLDVAHMAIHFGRLLSERRKAQVFDGITYGGARALSLDGYGLEPGCRADMVVLQAATPMEAVRLKATRLRVVRAGRTIARSEPRVASVTLGNDTRTVDFSAESVRH
ncbi:MAG: cytosine deaminase [Alphaproteobacteria bacterium]